ncbi:MAG TPA: GTPase HflX, partial [Tepidisphaeraceae bacterium]|nr:GTPase HflX [Tepidisphaeraceae bacterium]
MAELKRTELSVRQERAVLVGVILANSTADPRDPLGELASLAKTAGAKVVAQILQKRSRIDAATYIGSGKAIEIAELAKKHNADVVVFDNDLSPSQIGELEKLINEHLDSPRMEGVKVLDRSELILDIFATRARTAESKLQVELAQMQYTYPRLTKMWGHLERIAGGAAAGMGTRGPGEQQLEIDRRLVRGRINHLKKQIEKVQERKSRLVAERTRLHFTVCIVGYTNAGKSTLFNTLTAAGTYADDKLFATLDTKTRAWKLERGTEVLLSDTVGFVRDLPHGLVASFKATLEEAVHADLLLHVLDVGHPHADQQYQTVHEVLNEVGAKDKPEILLLNKIDTPDGEHKYHTWRTLHPDAIAISAKTGQGVDRLIESVYQFMRG